MCQYNSLRYKNSGSKISKEHIRINNGKAKKFHGKQERKVNKQLFYTDTRKYIRERMLRTLIFFIWPPGNSR